MKTHHDHSHSGHDHDHSHGGHDHDHSHGVVDPSIATSERGLWAVKWSGVLLLTVSFVELAVVAMSRSTALLADMIHNFGDFATVIPLWIAFALMRRQPGRKFSFGYGRVEDLAGVLVVAVLFTNALIAGYEAISRMFHPQLITHLGVVAIASIVSFAGNETVAILRINVGHEIGSAALIADGHHARVDGWTALAVLFGALGVYLGFPLADPIVGLVITVAIFGIVWTSAKTIFTRILDGVEPETLDQLRATALEVTGVADITDLRARWMGHQLYAEASIVVASSLSVGEAHVIASAVEHQLVRHVAHVTGAVIHVCPADNAGAEFHAVDPECDDCDETERIAPANASATTAQS
ncbi:MAG TPA: cation diffusion facilitator family transporter [Gemmatimonadaceae bacterium]